jgi:hypothetical protein
MSSAIQPVRHKGMQCGGVRLLMGMNNIMCLLD